MELATFARLYEPFYRRLTKNEGFTFNYEHPANLRLVNNFLEAFPQGIGKLALINFFAYQAWVWMDQDIRLEGGLNHPMMFGKQAIARYKARDHANNWLADQTLNDLKINKHNLLKSLEEQPYYDPKVVQESDDRERKRYYNQPVGFKHCLDFTTMYHPQSRVCAGCVYKGDCRQIVLDNFPAIAKARILRKEETTEKKELKTVKYGANANSKNA
jgi:hypothetical protein